MHWCRVSITIRWSASICFREEMISVSINFTSVIMLVWVTANNFGVWNSLMAWKILIGLPIESCSRIICSVIHSMLRSNGMLPIGWLCPVGCVRTTRGWIIREKSMPLRILFLHRNMVTTWTIQWVIITSMLMPFCPSTRVFSTERFPCNLTWEPVLRMTNIHWSVMRDIWPVFRINSLITISYRATWTHYPVKRITMIRIRPFMPRYNWVGKGCFIWMWRLVTNGLRSWLLRMNWISFILQ